MVYKCRLPSVPKKTKTRRRKAKKTDPEKPTRPQSAYFFWLNDGGRDDLRRRFPDLSITQLGKKAGEEWNALENKTKWVRQYDKAMKDYQKRLAAYKETKAESDKPARPQSAYFYWLGDGGRDGLKKRFPDLPVTQLAKKAGEEWNALEDKSKWVRMNEDAMKDYQERLAAYKEGLDGGTSCDMTTEKKRKRSQTVTSAKRRKKSPPASKKRKGKAPASSKKRKAKAPASSKKRKPKPAASKRRKAKATPAGGKKRKPKTP